MDDTRNVGRPLIEGRYRLRWVNDIFQPTFSYIPPLVVRPQSVNNHGVGALLVQRGDNIGANEASPTCDDMN